MPGVRCISARSVFRFASVVAIAQQTVGAIVPTVEIPTDGKGNAAVYVLYLRGRELETHGSAQDINAARDLYEQALELDHSFALGHASLSIVLSDLATSSIEQDRALAEAEEALRLSPRLGEAHFARAKCLQVAGDPDSAAREIDAALQDLPNDTHIVYLAASLHRRQGKWEQSLAEFRKALALDPSNLTSATDLAYHLSQMRVWPAATQAWDRALGVAPEWMFNKICRSYVDLWAKGDTTRNKALLASTSLDYQGQFQTFLQWMRWDTSLIERDTKAAEEAVSAMTSDPLRYGYPVPAPKSYFRGCIEVVRGDREAALAQFEQARIKWEADLKARPEFAPLHAQLGLLYALMGKNGEAIREGEHAAEITPPSKDAFDGTGVQTVLAMIYARSDQPEKSIALIRQLLSAPGALNYETSVTLGDLRRRWQWDPLRTNPEFQEIINGPEPKTLIR